MIPAAPRAGSRHVALSLCSWYVRECECGAEAEALTLEVTIWL